MRTPFDQLAKQVIAAALAAAGTAETDAEIAPDVRRIDVFAVPDPARLSALLPFGLLGRLASVGPCCFEPFHGAPNVADALACIHKVLGLRQVVAAREPPLADPWLWIISSGRPATAIEGLGFTRTSDWPDGVYLLAPAWKVGLVVASELPRTRDTLILRALGAGAALRQAIREMLELPADAVERTLVMPVLLRLRFEIPASPAERSVEDEELVMTSQEMVEAWEKKTRDEGLEEGMSTCIVASYEARFGAMPALVRDAVDGMHDAATLRAWAQIVAVDSADAIAEKLVRRRSS